MATDNPTSQTLDGPIAPLATCGTVSHLEAREAVKTLLRFIGDDPERDGLLDTPRRVVDALREMTAGLRDDPSEYLGVIFNGATDEMVVLRNIRFTSVCEHHLLPFVGFVDVGYIPEDGIVGISKLARVVHCFARRPQVQERLTSDIADAIQEYLKPKGVGVRIRAHHHCMGCRGVRLHEAEMITSDVRGVFRTKPEARAEFFDLVRSQ